jgi:hypothetical protein
MCDNHAAAPPCHILKRVLTICSPRAGFVVTNRVNAESSCEACAPCNSVYSLQHDWLVLTPQPRASVLFLSEPLSYCVALWGMTMRRDFRILLNRRKQ